MGNRDEEIDSILRDFADSIVQDAEDELNNFEYCYLDVFEKDVDIVVDESLEAGFPIPLEDAVKATMQKHADSDDPEMRNYVKNNSLKKLVRYYASLRGMPVNHPDFPKLES